MATNGNGDGCNYGKATRYASWISWSVLMIATGWSLSNARDAVIAVNRLRGDTADNFMAVRQETADLREWRARSMERWDSLALTLRSIETKLDKIAN